MLAVIDGCCVCLCRSPWLNGGTKSGFLDDATPRSFSPSPDMTVYPKHRWQKHVLGATDSKPRCSVHLRWCFHVKFCALLRPPLSSRTHFVPPPPPPRSLLTNTPRRAGPGSRLEDLDSTGQKYSFRVWSYTVGSVPPRYCQLTTIREHAPQMDKTSPLTTLAGPPMKRMFNRAGKGLRAML